MSKTALVATIVAALLATVGIWVYVQHLTGDAAIQRFNASATAIAAVAGLFAFLALIVYTVETANLRQVAERQVAVAQQQVREAQIQNETAVRPILCFDIGEQIQEDWGDTPAGEDSQTVKDAFVLRNLGLGPAFNIETTCDSDDVSLDLGPTILGQGQTVPVGIRVFAETLEQMTLSEVSRIRPLFRNNKLPERIEIRVTCQSSNRTRHETRFALLYNPEIEAEPLWIEFLAAE